MADQLIRIIEDNERNLKLVRDVLQFGGFRTAEARSAEDGLALATSCPPDLVLMDLQLPGIDGMEAFRQLRASPLTAEIPVVAVTAFAMKDDRERVLRAGFDGYLVKPISVRELPGQVRAFLTAKELSDDR
jgi:CheY-like chemotaxis protein